MVVSQPHYVLHTLDTFREGAAQVEVAELEGALRGLSCSRLNPWLEGLREPACPASPCDFYGSSLRLRAKPLHGEGALFYHSSYSVGSKVPEAQVTENVIAEAREDAWAGWKVVYVHGPLRRWHGDAWHPRRVVGF